jgi:hypothetical protein
VLHAYLAPWSDRSRHAPAVIAPRQLVAAFPYLAEVEAGLHTLADRPVLIVWGTRDFALREVNRWRFEVPSATIGPSCSTTPPISPGGRRRTNRRSIQGVRQETGRLKTPLGAEHHGCSCDERLRGQRILPGHY